MDNRCSKCTPGISTWVAAVAFVLATSPLAHGDELQVLDDPQAGRGAVRRHLMRLAADALDERDARYEALKTPENVAAYRRRLRRFFVEKLGGFPRRTPLNARIVGRLRGEGFRVEKIIFESRPRHVVTCALYLPEDAADRSDNSDPSVSLRGEGTRGGIPAVLVPCGHSANGKAAGAYQRACILLAKNGIAALCYDPIGQGERYQLLDDDGTPRFKSTTEHTLVGVGSILVGRNTASYRVWDGTRALDYLQNRDDIDGSRLGCTGNSGGGTLTEYLMALDNRIVCAAPGCSVTTFRRRLATIGPGDAEQNIHGQIAFGMDHPDYFHMRARRPTLILSATRDFVDIDGGWHIFREAKRLNTRLGHPERIRMIEADESHGFTQPLRVGMVRWMRRWLLGNDGGLARDAITEPEMEVFSDEQLRCSPTGQVQRMDGATSVMDLNLAEFDRLAPRRRKLWQAQNLERALAEVRRLTGIRSIDDIPIHKARKLQTLQRDGYAIEKYVLHAGGDIPLPALLLVPAKQCGRRYVYLHPQGKAADAAAGGAMEKLVRDGHLVLAIDVRGVGETGPQPNRWGGDWDDIFVAYLLGRSYLGMRAEDVLIAARFLAAYNRDAKQQAVDVVAIGNLGPPALHAAALQSSLFDRLTLHESITSWRDVLADPSTPGQLANTVHGALAVYDLPNLLQTLPKEHVRIRSPLGSAR